MARAGALQAVMFSPIPIMNDVGARMWCICAHVCLFWVGVGQPVFLARVRVIMRAQNQPYSLRSEA